MTNITMTDTRKAALLNFDVVRSFDELPATIKAATGGTVGKLLQRLRQLDDFAGAAAGCVLRLALLGKFSDISAWFTSEDGEDACSEYNALCLFMREVQAGNMGEDDKAWEDVAPAIAQLPSYAVN